MKASTDYDAEFVLDRDGHTCVYCGGVSNLCVDHMLPVIMGGTDDENNLACACKQCNSGKAGRTPEGAGYTIISAEASGRYHQYLASVTVTGPQGVTVTGPPTHARGTDTDTDTDIPSPSSQKGRETNPLLLILKGIKGYPFDTKTDQKLLADLQDDYPNVNAKLTVNDYAAWVLDHPITKKDSPRSRLRSFFRKAEEWRTERGSGDNGRQPEPEIKPKRYLTGVELVAQMREREANDPPHVLAVLHGDKLRMHVAQMKGLVKLGRIAALPPELIEQAEAEGIDVGSIE